MSSNLNSHGPLNHAALLALSKELKRPIDTLLVLDPGNDPFVADSRGLRGGPGRRAHAEWFADLWARLNIPNGVHQRRIHYIFVSQPTPIRMVNGADYVNSTECLQALNKAARDARTLELVPSDAIVDRRRSGMVEHLVDAIPAGLFFGGDDLDDLIVAMPGLPTLTLQAPNAAQHYHVELWAEKSTVDDVLHPLAEQFGLNVVSGAGEVTSFTCRDLVDRAVASERPVRILYISDFDPAGMSMPVAAARKIEHELYRRGLDLDVEVRPVVLTHDQCVEHRLPRTPLKDGEVRKARFQERFGEGATELDALEALHPGLLNEILRAEILRYFDLAVAGRVEISAANLEAELQDINEQVHQRHQSAVDALTADYLAIAESIASFRERAEPVYAAIEADLTEAAPDLAAVEWPQPGMGDEDPDPLFSSRRDYVSQVDRYKRHQGKPTTRQPYGTGAASAAKAKNHRAMAS